MVTTPLLLLLLFLKLAPVEGAGGDDGEIKQAVSIRLSVSQEKKKFWKTRLEARLGNTFKRSAETYAERNSNIASALSAGEL